MLRQKLHILQDKKPGLLAKPIVVFSNSGNVPKRQQPETEQERAEKELNTSTKVPPRTKAPWELDPTDPNFLDRRLYFRGSQAVLDFENFYAGDFIVDNLYLEAVLPADADKDPADIAHDVTNTRMRHGNSDWQRLVCTSEHKPAVERGGGGEAMSVLALEFKIEDGIT